MASTTFSAGFKLPKTVGSPIDREIIFLSGLGVRVIVSRIFRMGLKVFSDIMEARTRVHDLFCCSPLMLDMVRLILNCELIWVCPQFVALYTCALQRHIWGLVTFWLAPRGVLEAGRDIWRWRRRRRNYTFQVVQSSWAAFFQSRNTKALRFYVESIFTFIFAWLLFKWRNCTFVLYLFVCYNLAPWFQNWFYILDFDISNLKRIWNFSKKKGSRKGRRWTL